MDENKLKQIVALIDLTLTNDLIQNITNFSIKHQKQDTLKTINHLIKDFYQNLSPEEIAEFNQNINQNVAPKLNLYKQELQKVYSPEKVSEIIQYILEHSVFNKSIS
ncbi:MAG TPA: hypothetical protein PK639_00610 [Candidatus Woesebacteria bacterium]|nr:hypothetical protein [Candidatus Woesebacteria bacterium]